MDTIILDNNQLQTAAELIRQGEVVAFPTETVYGLGADALNASAVEKIFIAKGRPQDNPLIVHLSDIEQIYPLVREVPEMYFRLAERFIPGPLTVILKKSDLIPSVVVAGGDTVGIRIPSHPIAASFIELCGCPIAAPSANTSTHISPTTAAHVFEDLAGKIPAIIEGGTSQVGIESTVLDLTAETPTILRPGAVTAEMLLQVFQEVSTTAVAMRIARSPGMKYRHYAPHATAVLAVDIAQAVELYDRAKSVGKRPVLLIKDGSQVQGREHIDLGGDDQAVAHTIYAAMRDADKSFDYIVIEKPSESGIGNAILNRLRKATAAE